MGNLIDVKEILSTCTSDLANYKSRWEQLRRVMPNEVAMQEMSKKEMYAHVRAITIYTDTLLGFEDPRIGLAKQVIDGWITLADACEKDPNLAADWEAFMIVMKMMT